MSNLIKKGPIFPMFGSIFDDFFNKDFFDWSTKNFSEIGSTLPSVNVKESDKDYKIELAAPGLKKEDFKVELDNHVITISSEKKEEKEEKDDKGNYTRREFNYSSFRRSFTLPEESVESGKIEATYKDGILKITVPKKVKAEPKISKTIEVK